MAAFEPYDPAGITVLEGLEPVRVRPSMFVGATDSQGLERMFFGLLENALEEHLAGRASRVAVHITEAGQVTIEDDGAGIAIEGPGGLAKIDRINRHGEAKKPEGRRRVHINSESSGRRVAVVNALSSRFELESRRMGNSTRVVFERGELKDPPTSLGPTDAHGTCIQYRPDPEIFGTESLRVDHVADRLQELAWLCPKLDLRLQSRPLGDPRGLEAFLEHLAGTDLVKESLVRVNEEVDGVLVEVALGWKRSGVEADVRSFVNFRSSVSGSHVDAVFSALRPSSSLARARNTLRGLVAVVHVGIEWVHLEDGILDLPPVRRAVHTAIRHVLETGAPWWRRHLTD
jgi:DNA gyrase subunit B